MNHVRRGSGTPLLLVHGLGRVAILGPIMEELAAHREVIAVDLPGFRETPPLTGEAELSPPRGLMSGEARQGPARQKRRTSPSVTADCVVVPHRWGPARTEV